MSSRARYLGFLIALGVAAGCVRLGFWQLDRLEERRVGNGVARALRALPPVDLTLPGGRGLALEGRRVLARGVFEAGQTMVVRGQSDQGVVGVHLITPLRIEGADVLILVNRGFVTAADGISPDLTGLDEPGPVAIRGLALAITTAPDSGQPLERGGRLSWRRLDLAALRARLPAPVLPVYLLRDSVPATIGPRLRPVPAPALGNGPHLNYAIQWFGFALVGLVGGVVLFRKQAREPEGGPGRDA